jgi:hypothetical protein
MGITTISKAEIVIQLKQSNINKKENKLCLRT